MMARAGPGVAQRAHHAEKITMAPTAVSRPFLKGRGGAFLDHAPAPALADDLQRQVESTGAVEGLQYYRGEEGLGFGVANAFLFVEAPDDGTGRTRRGSACASRRKNHHGANCR